MPELPGWEIWATLGIKGEEEFRAKLADLKRLSEQTSQAMTVTPGAGGGGGVGIGAGGGGPSPSGRVPVNTPGGGLNPFNQSAYDALTNAGASPGEAAKFLGIRGGGGGGGSGRAPVSTPGGGGGLSGGVMGGSLVGRGRPEITTGLSGGVMGAGLVGRGAADTESAGRSGGTMGAELVAVSNRRAAEEIRKRALAEKEATESTRKFGLGQMWILRSATAGGPVGLLGGGMGAAAGLLAGNVGGGALLGNWAARSIQGGISGGMGALRSAVGAADPGAAFRHDRATADLQASFGRGLAPTLEYFTGKIRRAADAVATNQDKVEGFGRAITGVSEFFFQLSGVNKLLGAGKPGASIGAATSPLAGHIYGSADDVYRAFSQQMIMTGPAREAARANQETAEMARNVAGTFQGDPFKPGILEYQATKDKEERENILFQSKMADIMKSPPSRQTGIGAPSMEELLNRSLKSFSSTGSDAGLPPWQLDLFMNTIK